MGQRVTDTTTIDAPADVVWDVITDVEAYPQWADGVVRTEVLSTDDDGRPHQASFRIDAKAMQIDYVIEYRYTDRAVAWSLVEGETLSQLDGSYELSPGPGTSTGVRYSLEVDVDLPLPGFLKKRAAKTIIDQGLHGLKRRAEQGGRHAS